MAVDDLDILHGEMPHLFLPREAPTGFGEDWAFGRVRNPAAGDLEAGWFRRSDYTNAVSSQRRVAFETYERVVVPNVGEVFPGMPVPHDPSGMLPPPDALGFYLPFHSYHPVWWGIYLIAEGIEELGSFIESHADGNLDWSECLRASQLFIYFHEAFHHAVECLATRLEIIVRCPLKVGPFEDFYRQRLGTGYCTEEALACGHAIIKTSAAFDADPQKRTAVREALCAYVNRLPEDYRAGLKFTRRAAFESVRSSFAEDNLRNALPGMLPGDPGVWKSFPYAFSGIGSVNSRVNYIVHRSSPLFARVSAQGYFLTVRGLKKKLSRLAGCRFERAGGNHEIWIAPNGSEFSIPRHPGDLATGTLRKIIKQAGLDMSITQLIAKPM